mmetsp:Transcript_73176/g.219753  ORF Transcript_73176/g.219753 Transcript_73176/m.219753 type:complete len:216 (-) Transcript_73176:2377-3024(-)
MRKAECAWLCLAHLAHLALHILYGVHVHLVVEHALIRPKVWAANDAPRGGAEGEGISVRLAPQPNYRSLALCPLRSDALPLDLLLELELGLLFHVPFFVPLQASIMRLERQVAPIIYLELLRHVDLLSWRPTSPELYGFALECRLPVFEGRCTPTKSLDQLCLRMTVPQAGSQLRLERHQTLDVLSQLIDSERLVDRRPDGVIPKGRNKLCSDLF